MKGQTFSKNALLCAVLVSLLFWGVTSDRLVADGEFQIAFQSNRDSGVLGVYHLFIMNSDGSGLTRLFEFPTSGYYPIFSPDGTEISFEKRFAEIYRCEIWKINVDGTGLVQLTDPGPYMYSQEYPLDWSADGSKITLRSERANHNGWYEVYLMNFDGTNQVNYGEANGHTAEFSPDGTKIVYTKWYEGLIKTMNVDGTDRRVLYDTNVSMPGWIVWSHNGKIFFYDGPSVSSTDIYSINPDGTNLSLIYSSPGNDLFANDDFIISPDGSKLVFYSNANGNYDVYIVNVDGTNVQQLTTDPADDLDPLFSPDGSRIVWISKRSGTRSVWIMNADGSSKFQLTDDSGEDFSQAIGGEIAGEQTVYSIYALNSVWIRQGAVVNCGDIGVEDVSTGPWLDSQVELSIGKSAYIADGIDAAANAVKIKTNGSAYNVYYNDLINNGEIRGEAITPLELPLQFELPPFPVPAPGTGFIDIPIGETVIMEPGAYGEVIVRSNATLILTGGVYHLENLDLGDNGAKILFRDKTDLILNNRLEPGKKGFIGPEDGSGISAKDIIIYVNGVNGNTGNLGATPKAATVGLNNVLKANIYAPNGTIKIRENSSAEGSFIGKDVLIGLFVQVTLNSAFEN